jgi:hypothetical protein
VDLAIDVDIEKQIDSIVEKLLHLYNTLLKQGVSFIKDTCLAALVDASTL